MANSGSLVTFNVHVLCCAASRTYPATFVSGPQPNYLGRHQLEIVFAAQSSLSHWYPPPLALALYCALSGGFAHVSHGAASLPVARKASAGLCRCCARARSRESPPILPKKEKERKPKVNMRIGCLQFAPKVGDVDNNLNRADAVLSRANPDDLDSLDLLVVPEMAFSGEHRDGFLCNPEMHQPREAYSRQGTIFSHYSISLRFLSMRAAGSAHSGRGRWPSATIATSSSGTLSKSMSLTSGRRRPNITMQPPSSTTRVSPSRTTGSIFCT